MSNRIFFIDEVQDLISKYNSKKITIEKLTETLQGRVETIEPVFKEIRNEDEYNKACKQIEALGDLIVAYDEKNHPIPNERK